MPKEMPPKLCPECKTRVVKVTRGGVYSLTCVYCASARNRRLQKPEYIPKHYDDRKCEKCKALYKPITKYQKYCQNPCGKKLTDKDRNEAWATKVIVKQPRRNFNNRIDYSFCGVKYQNTGERYERWKDARDKNLGPDVLR